MTDWTNQPTNQPTKSTKQIPSFEAMSPLNGQEIPPHIMEPKGSLPQLQELTNCHYPVPDKTTAHIPIYLFETHFNCILSSTLPSGLFP